MEGGRKKGGVMNYWETTKVDQSVITQNGLYRTTVRDIEMQDSGPIYGRAVLDRETWVVQLQSPGCWLGRGTVEQLSREVIG